MQGRRHRFGGPVRDRQDAVGGCRQEQSREEEGNDPPDAPLEAPFREHAVDVARPAQGGNHNMIERQVLVEDQAFADPRMIRAHDADKPVREELAGPELGRKVPEYADRKVRSPIPQRNPVVHQARKEPQRYVRGFRVQKAVHCRSQDEQHVIRGEDGEGTIQAARGERHGGAQDARCLRIDSREKTVIVDPDNLIISGEEVAAS